MTALEIGPLYRQMWPEAMRLCARAFADYGYVRALYGDDPLDRIAGTMTEYGHIGWDEGRISFGAWAGAALVGTASIERLGRCHVCEPGEQDEQPDDDRLAAAAERFDEMRRLEHARVPAHGHVVMVAVEPVVQRAGVGRAVIDAAVGSFRDEGGGPLVLECILALEPYYASQGFRTIGGFEEPDSDDIAVMQADV
jgi:ribosomal protein S18 acetylase RimI-like enzyme